MIFSVVVLVCWSDLRFFHRPYLILRKRLGLFYTVSSVDRILVRSFASVAEGSGMAEFIFSTTEDALYDPQYGSH